LAGLQNKIDKKKISEGATALQAMALGWCYWKPKKRETPTDGASLASLCCNSTHLTKILFYGCLRMLLECGCFRMLFDLPRLMLFWILFDSGTQVFWASYKNLLLLLSICSWVSNHHSHPCNSCYVLYLNILCADKVVSLKTTFFMWCVKKRKFDVKKVVYVIFLVFFMQALKYIGVFFGETWCTHIEYQCCKFVFIFYIFKMFVFVIRSYAPMCQIKFLNTAAISLFTRHLEHLNSNFTYSTYGISLITALKSQQVKNHGPTSPT
jgi:hypothetical protein